MSKKKKQKRLKKQYILTPTTPGNPPQDMQRLMEIFNRQPARWPTTDPRIEVVEAEEAFSVETAREMLNDQGYFEKMWSVEQSKQVKDGFYGRDGFVVAVPTPAADRAYHETYGGDPTQRSIACIAVSAHSDLVLTITLDVEDVKQLVNRLSEAVAMVEGRKAKA